MYTLSDMWLIAICNSFSCHTCPFGNFPPRPSHHSPRKESHIYRRPLHAWLVHYKCPPLQLPFKTTTLHLYTLRIRSVIPSPQNRPVSGMHSRNSQLDQIFLLRHTPCKQKHNLLIVILMITTAYLSFARFSSGSICPFSAICRVNANISS